MKKRRKYQFSSFLIIIWLKYFYKILQNELKKEGRKPLLVACDLVRPAAMEQLSVLGSQIEVPVYKEEGAKDPVKVYKAALAWAKKNPVDTLIIDTTGRLQIDELMQ